jgi:hypothetical protein
MTRREKIFVTAFGGFIAYLVGGFYVSHQQEQAEKARGRAQTEARDAEEKRKSARIHGYVSTLAPYKAHRADERCCPRFLTKFPAQEDITEALGEPDSVDDVGWLHYRLSSKGDVVFRMSVRQAQEVPGRNLILRYRGNHQCIQLDDS